MLSWIYRIFILTFELFDVLLFINVLYFEENFPTSMSFGRVSRQHGGAVACRDLLAARRAEYDRDHMR